MDSNQYAIELVTYLLVLVVYFYELIVYMLLERNAFDSIAFFLSVQNSESINVSSENKVINNAVFLLFIPLTLKTLLFALQVLQFVLHYLPYDLFSE